MSCSTVYAPAPLDQDLGRISDPLVVALKKHDALHGGPYPSQALREDVFEG